MEADRADRAGVGIGLRQPHYAAWSAGPPALGFVEVHSENFYADGGAALGVLERVRATHAVSLHGVGLALGSAAGLDDWHLDRLARLVDRIDPVRVSDHASFARATLPAYGRIVHANDLLPVAHTPEALAIMVRNVTEVQERLRRPILVENLSAYLSYADAPLAESEFFAQLCRKAGCAMLLDLNNLMVNALNAGAADPLADCRAFVDALPPSIVGEIHLAGHAHVGTLVIDDHGSRVAADVWALYRHAVRRLGARPTLIEWDTDVPPLAVLLDEADHAVRELAAALPTPA
ncbi:MAG: DUF692 domain-containing protein [Proteobacteria bacterium]|nr:DUF692 domain-containing protein [Pseudomonadota bacterium]